MHFFVLNIWASYSSLIVIVSFVCGIMNRDCGKQVYLGKRLKILIYDSCKSFHYFAILICSAFAFSGGFDTAHTAAR